MQPAQNRNAEEEEEEGDGGELKFVEDERVDSEERRRYIEENDINFDDEPDEFEQLKMLLEPKYQRYARWKI